MAFIRPALAAATLAIASFAAPIAAHAANTAIVIVDYGRVYDELAAGKDAQAKMKVIADGVNRELAPEAQGLGNDEKAIAPSLQGKSQGEISALLQSDKALAAKYTAYLKRGQILQNKQELRSAELQATEKKALSDVLVAAQPVIQDVAKSRGASIVAEKGAVIYNTPDVDITSEVIAKLNGRVTSVSVTKVDLTKQQGQQPR